MCEYFVGVLLLGVQSCREPVHCTFRHWSSSRDQQRLPSLAETDADNGRWVRSSRLPSRLSDEPRLVRCVPLCVQHAAHQSRIVRVRAPHVDVLLHDAGADHRHHVGHQRRAVLATFHERRPATAASATANEQ